MHCFDILLAVNKGQLQSNIHSVSRDYSGSGAFYDPYETNNFSSIFAYFCEYGVCLERKRAKNKRWLSKRQFID